MRVGLVNSADLVRLDRSQHTGSAPSVGAYLRRSLGFTRDRSQVPSPDGRQRDEPTGSPAIPHLRRDSPTSAPGLAPRELPAADDAAHRQPKPRAGGSASVVVQQIEQRRTLEEQTLQMAKLLMDEKTRLVTAESLLQQVTQERTGAIPHIQRVRLCTGIA